MNIKQEMMKLSQKYPSLKEVRVRYEGSGDNFGDFWNTEFDTKDGGLYGEPPGDDFVSDANDLLWHAIDRVGASFNDNGSEGTITFNFEDMKLFIQNGWKETITNYEDVLVVEDYSTEPEEEEEEGENKLKEDYDII